jgi:hypothetical protein
VHRIVMVISLSSLLWGWWALPHVAWHLCPITLPLTFAIALGGSTMWGVASIYVIDLIASHLDRNSHFLKVFYKQLHDDLIGLVVMAVLTVGLTRRAGIVYNFTSTDIAGAGLPFFITAILTILRISGRSGALQFTSKAKVALISLNVAAVLISLLAVLRVMTNSVSPMASAWIQTTILAAGFAAYVGAKQLKYFYEHRRVAYSPTIQRMFFHLRGAKPGMYDMTVAFADRFNKQMRVVSSRRSRNAKKCKRRGG